MEPADDGPPDQLAFLPSLALKITLAELPASICMVGPAEACTLKEVGVGGGGGGDGLGEGGAGDGEGLGLAGEGAGGAVDCSGGLDSSPISEFVTVAPLTVPRVISLSPYVVVSAACWATSD